VRWVSLGKNQKARACRICFTMIIFFGMVIVSAIILIGIHYATNRNDENEEEGGDGAFMASLVTVALNVTFTQYVTILSKLQGYKSNTNLVVAIAFQIALFRVINATAILLLKNTPMTTWWYEGGLMTQV
jgi:hypothetical protein